MYWDDQVIFIQWSLWRMSHRRILHHHIHNWHKSFVTGWWVCLIVVCEWVVVFWVVGGDWLITSLSGIMPISGGLLQWDLVALLPNISTLRRSYSSHSLTPPSLPLQSLSQLIHLYPSTPSPLHSSHSTTILPHTLFSLYSFSSLLPLFVTPDSPFATPATLHHSCFFCPLLLLLLSSGKSEIVANSLSVASWLFSEESVEREIYREGVYDWGRNNDWWRGEESISSVDINVLSVIDY